MIKRSVANLKRKKSKFGTNLLRNIYARKKGRKRLDEAENRVRLATQLPCPLSMCNAKCVNLLFFKYNCQKLQVLPKLRQFLNEDSIKDI